MLVRIDHRNARVVPLKVQCGWCNDAVEALQRRKRGTRTRQRAGPGTLARRLFKWRTVAVGTHWQAGFAAFVSPEVGQASGNGCGHGRGGLQKPPPPMRIRMESIFYRSIVGFVFHGLRSGLAPHSTPSCIAKQVSYRTLRVAAQPFVE